MSSWTRAIVIPLSVVHSANPMRPVPEDFHLRELHAPGVGFGFQKDEDRLFSWRNFFLVLDRITHWAERVHIRPLRTIALRKAEKWMLEHFEMSDGLGAIYPSMMNAIIALRRREFIPAPHVFGAAAARFCALPAADWNALD